MAHVLFKSRIVQHLIEELIQNGRKQIKLTNKALLTIKDLNDLKAIANQISGPLKFEESPPFETLYATFFHQAGLLTASEVGDDYCGFCGNEATHLCLHLVICPNITYRNILTEKIVENFIALDEELWKRLKNISIALLKIIEAKSPIAKEDGENFEKLLATKISKLMKEMPPARKLFASKLPPKKRRKK